MSIEPTKYAFKLLHGKHREKGMTYVPGQIVCSNAELDKLHNNGNIKFVRQDETTLLNEMAKRGYKDEPDAPQATVTTQPLASDDLDKMSIEDLKLHAQSEEIDLKGVNLKDKKAIIAAIIRNKPVVTK